MEEDIKRISNLIEYIENADYVDASQCFNCEDIKAIENLLNRVKELEKIEQEHQKINGELRERVKELEEGIAKEYTLGFSQASYDVNKLWKDKIKEKIEELKHKDFLKLQVCCQHDNKALMQIQVLQELLEV